MNVSGSKSPQQITTATLRALWVPHWETGQVANAGCSQLTDWSGNGFHIVQATGSLQPLWKHDTNYGGKWYIKFDGVNDVLSCATDPLSTSNGQLFIILRNANQIADTLSCRNFVYTFNNSINSKFQSTIGGTGYSYPMGFVITTGSTGYSLQQAAMFARQTASGNYLNANSAVVSATEGSVYSATKEISGIKLGGSSANIADAYWVGRLLA